LVFITFNFFKNPNHKFRFEHRNLVLFITLILFLLLPSAGSNTGLSRSSISIVFLPVFLINNFQSWKKYFVYIIIAILPFTIYDRFDKLFGDNNFKTLETELQNTKFKGIYTKNEKVKVINKINDLVSGINEKNEKVIFYGFMSHPFIYKYVQTRLKFVESNIKLLSNFNVYSQFKYNKPILKEISNQYKYLCIFVNDFELKIKYFLKLNMIDKILRIGIFFKYFKLIYK